MNTITGVHPDFSTSEFVSKKHAEDAGCVYLLEKAPSGSSDRHILDLEENRLPFIKIGNWKAHKPYENDRYSVIY